MNHVLHPRRVPKWFTANPFLTVDVVDGERRYRTVDKVVLGQCKVCQRRNVNVLNLLCQECFFKGMVE